eukprot:m.28465 g.28465  ORF g.28465 m.28465 type:complete len:134 (+) comp30799_c0_seq5:253-654(+)
MQSGSPKEPKCRLSQQGISPIRLLETLTGSEVERMHGNVQRSQIAFRTPRIRHHKVRFIILLEVSCGLVTIKRYCHAYDFMKEEAEFVFCRFLSGVYRPRALTGRIKDQCFRTNGHSVNCYHDMAICPEVDLL